MSDEKTKRKRTPKVDMPALAEKTLELHAKGLTMEEVSKVTGLCVRSCWDIVDAARDSAGAVKAYRDKRTDAMTHLQAKAVMKMHTILDSMTDDEIAAATVRDKSSMLAVLSPLHGTAFDKERLLSGQSTNNVQSLLLVAQRGAMATLNARLGIPERPAESDAK